jgi:holliday junction DNA helicase RuvA
MIGRLCGKVVGEEPDGSVVLDVSGVGYDVMTPLGTLGRARGSGDGLLVLHIHTHVREAAFDLFGFASELDRRVFRLLLGVPNVGPKLALNALSALPLEELTRAVHAGDVARLTRVPGIGKKTAERLVLELKEKLPRLAAAAGPPAPGGPAPTEPAARLIGALTNMGYRTADAERAVRALGDRASREPLQDLLRQALGYLTP